MVKHAYIKHTDTLLVCIQQYIQTTTSYTLSGSWQNITNWKITKCLQFYCFTITTTSLLSVLVILILCQMFGLQIHSEGTTSLSNWYHKNSTDVSYFYYDPYFYLKGLCNSIILILIIEYYIAVACSQHNFETSFCYICIQ